MTAQRKLNLKWRRLKQRLEFLEKLATKTMKGNMKKIIGITAIILSCSLAGQAQSNTSTASSVLTELESYLVNNDTNYNGWANNNFTIWEAAVFSSVNGTAGESSLGNDLGLELPIHKYNLHLDSVTRFEQLFGDVHSQSAGVAYDYNVHQLQLSAGLDARYVFTGNHLQAVPYLEFKKASTSLYGTAPFVRYSYPVQSKPGAGEVDIGLSVSF